MASVASPPVTPRFSDSPNARSKSITTADSIETYGILNRHSPKNTAYQVGVSEDKGIRRTMEDAHSFVVDFAGVRGQGFFAVFDGHAGKHAAEWCGNHFHTFLLDALKSSPGETIPDVLNQTFHSVDASLSKMCEESDGKLHSGCTAVTAFLRIEDADGKQSFILSPTHSIGTSTSRTGERSESPAPVETGDSPADSGSESPEGGSPDKSKGGKKKGTSSRIKKALKSLSGNGGSSHAASAASPTSTPRSTSPVQSRTTHAPTTTSQAVMDPPSSARRVLYTANAGDARGVLCRNGKAVRLTYDHKGSDKQEAKRITDAGGFVMSGRVNGVLAVTRSLGDSSMKDFVVGAPYTTETELCDEDEFLILACDGLWDVASDQAAVDLIRDVSDAQEASQMLVEHALSRSTTDNVTVLVVRFKHGKSSAI